MNFLEFAKSRYSVRDFEQREIEQEKLMSILEAGRVAPTACNNQPQKVYVVKSEEKLGIIRGLTPCAFNAPVVLVVCYDRTRDWKNRRMPGYESGETDAAIVCTHMMLEAWQQGIGSCWVGIFNSDDVKAGLGLPENLTVAALMPMGYPAEGVQPNPLHYSIREFDDTIEVL